MSGTEPTNFPPDEVVQSLLTEKKNFEHIILWMLNNNDKVEWADFKRKPIDIAQSTLSNYMTKLLSRGYVEKIERGKYRITSIGEERYNELSRVKEVKRKLNIPPDVITQTRNYSDIILWMAYNNNYLKWSDFIEEDSPVRINQSSLSKNLNILLDDELIRKGEKKEYKITRLGKAEYAKILKSYDLDRQSILNEESKRIEEITKRTIRFFEKYNIKDDDIKFRFLNNVLTLPFEKLRGSLDSESDFNKILLFLSMNHPNQYPEYISPENFSKEYGIDKLDLEFNIRKIVEKNVYSIKFFQLFADEEKVYYFQANEKIEKVLSAITEDHITKFTYLNKLYEKTRSGRSQLTLESTTNSIILEICEQLFDARLKDSLREFLPEYIKYLAYKMETQKRLEEITDKLEGTIWRDFQYYSATNQPPKSFDEDHEYYYLVPQIFEILDDSYIIPSIEDVVRKTKKALKNKYEYKRALKIVNTSIKKGLDNTEIKLFKAIVLCYLDKFFEAIDIIESEVDYEQYEDEEDLYVVSSFILAFSYSSLGNANDALKIVNKTYNLYPENPIVLATKALIYGYSIIYNFEIEEGSDDSVLDLIDEVIRIDPKITNKARYYQFKSIVMEQMDQEEEGLEEINTALDLTDDIVDLYYAKSKILSSLGRYDEALETLKKIKKKFPDNKKYVMMQEAYVLKMSGDLQSGLDIITELTEEYEKDIDFNNNKAYWHIYIYKENQEKGIEDEENKLAAIETIKTLTEMAPEEGNYFDSYGEIMMITGDYENAIKLFEKAIKTEPNGWFIPETYLKLGKCNEKLGFYEKAEENFKKARQIVRYCFCHIKYRKEWIEEIEYNLRKIRDKR
ncbi:MAG: tetratricopeptide repeat protein [Promethearchaeota archaeon]